MHAFPAVLARTPRVSTSGTTSFAAIVRPATLAAGASTVVAAGLAGLVSGPAGALSALIGGAIVTVVLLGGLSGLRVLLTGLDSMAIAVALSVYVVQLSVLFSALLWVRQLGWIEILPFGLSALAVTLAWQAGLVGGALTARQFVYDGAGPGS